MYENIHIETERLIIRKLDRIIATVNESNGASIKVVEKMGMHFKYAIEDESAKGSSYEGELLYSIVRELYKLQLFHFI